MPLSADISPPCLPLESFALDIDGRRWNLRAVRDQQALLDMAERFAHVPYGLLLWESAVVMAEVLAARGNRLHGMTVLELGAGVGLAGLVAANRGAVVCQTDHEPVALAVAADNARRNNVRTVTPRLADWRHWSDDSRYDLIIGADIVYERQAQPFIAAIIERNLAPAGRALLTDPGRPHTLEFLAHLEDAGWRIAIEVRRTPDLLARPGAGAVEVTVIEIRRPQLPRQSHGRRDAGI